VQRHIGRQNGDVVKSLGYGLLLSAMITVGWIAAIAAVL
jgi:hypothetical protein